MHRHAEQYDWTTIGYNDKMQTQKQTHDRLLILWGERRDAKTAGNDSGCQMLISSAAIAERKGTPADPAEHLVKG